MVKIFSTNDNARKVGNAIEQVLKTSVLVDGLDPDKRGIDYVLRKSTEELGELSVEVQVVLGESYKEPGKDGITGEAIDLMITAIDMIYRDNHDKMSLPEMMEMIKERTDLKLHKWVNSITLRNKE